MPKKKAEVNNRLNDVIGRMEAEAKKEIEKNKKKTTKKGTSKKATTKKTAESKTDTNITNNTNNTIKNENTKKTKPAETKKKTNTNKTSSQTKTSKKKAKLNIKTKEVKIANKNDNNSKKTEVKSDKNEFKDKEVSNNLQKFTEERYYKKNTESLDEISKQIDSEPSDNVYEPVNIPIPEEKESGSLNVTNEEIEKTIELEQEKLDEIEKEIQKQKEISPKRKNKIRNKILGNVIHAIFFILLIFMLNLVFLKFDTDVFRRTLKVTSIVSMIATIVFYEISFTKNSSTYAIHGIEMMAFSIYLIYSLSFYKTNADQYVKINVIAEILIIVYYIIKSIVMNIQMRKKSEHHQSDIRAILRRTN